MPIDPTGTNPEPLTVPEKIPEVNLKCKRGGCDSIRATEVKIPGNTTASGRHMYACIKCKHTWNVNLGGNFEY